MTKTLIAWVRDSCARLMRDEAEMQRTARIVARFIEDCDIEQPADLRPAALANWLAGLAARRKPRTVRNHLAAIRQWSRWLEVQGIVERQPFESVKTARCDGDDGVDAITEEQAERLIANARDELHDRRGTVRKNAPARLVAYVLMLDCGLRISEVRAQRWDDVDLDRREMRITRDKARRNDRVPLGDRAVEVLRMLREVQADGDSEERVVPVGPNAKKLRDDLDRVGCRGEPGVYHRLRKSAITQRALAGVPLAILARWARHRDPATTMRYVRPTVDEMRRAMAG
jgi:integrase